MAHHGFLLLFWFLITHTYADDKVNYCHKPEVDTQWGQLLARTLRDPIVIRLYALQNALGEMIDSGQL